MGSRARKDQLFDGFAAIGKALASGRRLELVDVLAQGPRSVEHLAAEIGQSVANTSAHLRTLAAAGLVTSERDGNRVVYALAGPSVETLWAALRATGTAHLAALDRLATDYLGDRGELEVVTRAELAARLRRVPGGAEVVAYCRGPFCVYADEAVRMLQLRKVRARRLEDGFPEWRQAQLPVAVGAEPGARR